MSGPPRSDPYRVVGDDPDPDLALPDPDEEDHPRWTTIWALDAAQKSTREAARLLVVVRCVPAGCGRGKRDGARLAGVYRTPEGLLYLAPLIIAADQVPTFEQLHGDDAMVMHHPKIDAERGTPYSSASWTHRRAFELHHSGKGWLESPAGVRPAEGWRKPRRTWVRDLLDRDDLEHPPLRAQCHRHGETVLDAAKVLRHAKEAAKSVRRVVTVDQVR